MKTIYQSSRNQRISSDSGVALVLTLALIVVATVIVTAFFFRARVDSQGSSGYTEQVSAANLAELGASQAIASLLTEATTEIPGEVEIAPGTGDNPVYLVKEPRAMLPKKVRRPVGSGASDPYFNLVKQSIPEFNSEPYRLNTTVSNILTSTEAANRGGLDGNFWAKSYLTNDGSDFYTDENVPNWIYVAADGSTPTSVTSSNEDPIVGRYAFNVYDIGGLLDMNAAGFNPAAPPELVGRKGSLVFADIEALAGLAGVNLPSGFMDRFNSWRYKSDLQWEFASDSDDMSDSLAKLVQAGPLFASLGYYNPGVDPVAGSGDGRLNRNAFFSRQDLIRYLEKELGEADARRFLPYLTQFTRGLNKPFFLWDARPTGGMSPNWNSVQDRGIAAQINGPVWDESSGKMKVSRRFPLDRLKLLELDASGKPTGDPELIKKYFGLEWNTRYSRWVYNPIKRGATDEIYPLLRKIGLDGDVNPDQLSQGGMELNFFETLGAAINTGSLGQQLGGVADEILGEKNRPHAPGTDDSKVAQHIIRIGAAIIDQWDRDSWPTEIEFDGKSIFGVEDIPYLHGFKRMSYFGWGVGGPEGNSTANGKYLTFRFNSSVDPDWLRNKSIRMTECMMYLHPQVWNPNSPLSGQSPPELRPTKFRITPYTRTHRAVSGNKNVPTPATMAPLYGTDFGRNPRFISHGIDHASANGCLRYDWYADKGEWVGNQPIPLDWTSYNPPLEQARSQTDGGGGDWMTFEDIRGNGNVSDLRSPTLLWKPNIANVETASGGPWAKQPFNIMYGGLSDPTWGVYSARDPRNDSDRYRIGFQLGNFLGKVPEAFANPPNGQQPSDYAFPIKQAAIGAMQVDLMQFGSDFRDDYSRVNFVMEYLGPDGRYRPYDFMYDILDYFTQSVGSPHERVWRVIAQETDATFRSDPRVERFGPQSQALRMGSPDVTGGTLGLNAFRANETGWEDATRWTFQNMNYPGGGNYWITEGWVLRAYNISPQSQSGTLRPNVQQWRRENGGLLLNVQSNIMGITDYAKGLSFATLAQNKQGSGLSGGIYYQDPDKQIRLGDGGWATNFDGGFGNPVREDNTVQKESRPIILNRPFQSVTEMGYASRDLPWKSVDFWSSNSGDAALLDYFCLHEADADPNGPQLTAGVINLNSASPLVIASLISRGTVKADGSTPISSARALDIADALYGWLHRNEDEGLLRTRGEIVGRWRNNSYEGPFSGNFNNSGAYSSNPFSEQVKTAFAAATSTGNLIDAQRTNLMRTLVDSTETRTWNLMIDVVAQSGKVAPGSTSLDKFIVGGQARYWVFVAIDRFTGKIVDQKVEAVF